MNQVVGRCKSRTLRKAFVLFLGMVLAEYLSIAQLSYAAPPEGKGNDKENNGKAVGQDKTTPAQEKKADAASERSERGQSERVAQSAEAPSRGRSDEASIERQHPHQERGALDAVDGGGAAGNGQGGQTRLAQAAHAGTGGRGGDHGVRGREAAKAHVDELLKSLNKMEKARWDYNPHDTRGQGNMGKVDMRSPYGFDKNSGREGSERGRPIREEPTLNLAELVTVSFQVIDFQLLYLQSWLKWAQTLYNTYTSLAQYNSRYASYATYYATQITYYQNLIAAYQPPPYDRVVVNSNMSLNYTLNLGTQEGFEGTSLLVSTTLTSINDYNAGTWVYDSATRTWKIVYVTYDAGETVMTQTQEVTMGEDSTYSFSYDPPDSLVGWSGGYFEMAVTVTEPVSGASYTIPYDRDLYLYRCPYGIVYDKTTGKPIVGATVAVHNANGSLVLLDKASNPNVSNPQVTDATGRYNAKLAIGKKYYLTVKAPGYAEYNSPLFSERWHIVREDVGLTPVQPVAQPFSDQGSLPVPSEADEQPPTALTPWIGIGAPVPVGK